MFQIVIAYFNSHSSGEFLCNSLRYFTICKNPGRSEFNIWMSTKVIENSHIKSIFNKDCCSCLDINGFNRSGLNGLRSETASLHCIADNNWRVLYAPYTLYRIATIASRCERLLSDRATAFVLYRKTIVASQLSCQLGLLCTSQASNPTRLFKPVFFNFVVSHCSQRKYIWSLNEPY